MVGDQAVACAPDNLMAVPAGPGVLEVKIERRGVIAKDAGFILRIIHIQLRRG